MEVILQKINFALIFKAKGRSRHETAHAGTFVREKSQRIFMGVSRR